MHQTVLVHVPKEYADDIEGYVTDAMSPFDESLSVDPYIVRPADYVKKDYADRPREYMDKTIEEWASSWYSGSLDSEGNIVSTCNPRGYWDWYVVGGRWDGDLLQIKPDVEDDIENNTISCAGLILRTAEGFYTAAIVYQGEWIDIHPLGEKIKKDKVRDILNECDTDDLFVLIDAHY